jgi:hypothetical protein
MKVAYKNYKRTDRVELSIKSVKHFYPHIDIYCLCLYDESEKEYDGLIDNLKNMNVNVCFNKNKHKLGPAHCSPVTGAYYAEYLNYFAEMFSNEEKLIAMDEDMYFTSGETLRWLETNEYDLSCGVWWGGPNAAILGINFKKLNQFFPLPEIVEPIENLLQRELCDKALSIGAIVKQLPTRIYTDYFNDGSYSNDTNQIKQHLIESKII